jgi:GT2 family glycosyltransferase
MSDDVDSIIEFYESFKDREELIQWMRERPKGTNYIYDIEGEEEVIVVIPTANYNGEYAIECRENIFRGLHMIFVESGGTGDFYFNLAHNYNAGIKKALEYDPKWIVLSNDDLIKMNDIEILKNSLLNIDNEKYDVIFTIPSKYHSTPVFFSKQNALRKLLFTFWRKRSMQLKVERKFETFLFSSPIRGYGTFFFKHGYRHLSIADFGIFSTEFIKKHHGLIYDETYINSGEDVDLSLEVTLDNKRFRVIDYEIGDHIGGTLGTDVSRKIRDIAGNAYLNYKITRGIHPASTAIKST